MFLAADLLKAKCNKTK